MEAQIKLRNKQRAPVKPGSPWWSQVGQVSSGLAANSTARLELQLVNGEVVGGDTGIVLLVEADHDWVTGLGLGVDSDNLAVLVVPVRLRALDLNHASLLWALSRGSLGGGLGGSGSAALVGVDPLGTVSNASVNVASSCQRSNAGLGGHHWCHIHLLLGRSSHLSNGHDGATHGNEGGRGDGGNLGPRILVRHCWFAEKTEKK
mmetsp:Transcript_68488/g.115118  ORF Transcript_68488/g.115118 Transcript_68488/m.115118 type:complete len:204 (+) Transcript_68488:633-1244(+)